jgi:ferritin-like metal-binding protein YciE
MQDVLLEEMRDVYFAERLMVKSLPKMVRMASDEQLKKAFERHLEETKVQVERLEQAFEALETKPRAKTCEGMHALIAAAQKAEHYEIASYGTLRTWAQMLGQKRVVDLLEQTLDEEKMTDEKLNELAMARVNEQARASGAA